MNQIHGHEVLKLIINHKIPIKTKELLDKIVASYGEKAKFYTCSEKNLNALELIQFLINKGKILKNNGMLSSELSKICTHS